MRSCIVLFYISGSSLLARGAPPPRAEDLGLERRLSASAVAAEQDADRLYADRGNLASARRAAEIWSADLARDPGAFEAAWKLARDDYWLGGHAPESERRRFLEDGIAAARKAIAAQPGRPEGHFWLAATMGTLAESYGLRQGLKYRKPIKEALETVLRIDPAFQQGSADRALGRWYFRVPGLFGGSNKLAEQHLRKSLTYNRRSTASHFFLAELLLDAGRKSEARSELQRVIDAPPDPEWAPEDRDFQEKARRLIAGLTP
jgi:tetratricopeptide (TPR) repeat protein